MAEAGVSPHGRCRQVEKPRPRRAPAAAPRSRSTTLTAENCAADPVRGIVANALRQYPADEGGLTPPLRRVIDGAHQDRGDRRRQDRAWTSICRSSPRIGDYELVGVVSQRGVARAKASRPIATPAALYAAAEVDAVAICTPPHVRHAIAREALGGRQARDAGEAAGRDAGGNARSHAGRARRRPRHPRHLAFALQRGGGRGEGAAARPAAEARCTSNGKRT